jgi:hypothetical protein
MATVEPGNLPRALHRPLPTTQPISLGPPAPAPACGAATCRAPVRGTPRKLLQLNQLQPERLDPRDEAVQRGTVGHRTDQQGLGCRSAELERVERPEQPGRQSPSDPKGVRGAHGVLRSRGAALSHTRGETE